MANQPGIVLYRDNYQSVREILSQSQKGDLLDALMTYGETGEEYQGGDPLVSMAFNIFSAAIRRTEEKYLNRCKRNAENIRKRWDREKAASDTVEYDRIPEDTNGYKRPEKEKETQTQKETKTKTKREIFLPPSVEEVRTYCQERGNTIDAEQFVNYYAVRGWEIRQGQKMKDWKAAVRTWEGNARRWTDGLRGAETENRVRGQRELYDL